MRYRKKRGKWNSRGKYKSNRKKRFKRSRRISSYGASRGGIRL